MSAASGAFSSLLKDMEEYPEWAAKNANRQIGRYQGWMLLSNKAAIEAKENYSVAQAFVESKGYMIKHWSSISMDEDDKEDLGIKKAK